jgi:hypothetical protein
MALKTSLFALFYVTFVAQCNGQGNEQFIQNDSIQYTLAYVGSQLLDNNQLIPSKWIIVVGIRSKQEKIVKAMKRDEWIRLLSDSNTDWAANLILYALYRKDAVLYNSVIKSRKDWVNLDRDKDVTYWKKILR